MPAALRIVVISPDLDVADAGDEDALSQADRSRSLRIGLHLFGASPSYLDPGWLPGVSS